jgi:hypothetical protein
MLRSGVPNMLMGNLRGAQDSLKFRNCTLPYPNLPSKTGPAARSLLNAYLEKQIQRENDTYQEPQKGRNPSGDGPFW